MGGGGAGVYLFVVRCLFVAECLLVGVCLLVLEFVVCCCSGVFIVIVMFVDVIIVQITK